jgi:hypothetical protein
MPIGTVVSRIDQAPPRSAPTSTDAAFVVGETGKGPVGTYTEIRSMTRFEAVYGKRESYTVKYVYDAVETIFREGGSTVYVSRVVGPTPTLATVKLNDQSGSADPADVALIVTAKNAGSWGASLNVEVTVASTNFTIIVSHDTDGVLENSGTLADRAAAVAWATASSDYIDIALGTSAEDPRAQGPLSLVGGTDDRANIVDAQWATALAVFDKTIGPGQVLAPGRTTTAGYTQLLSHAASNNRVALLDGADTPTVSTLTTAAALQQSDVNGRFGQLLAPWAIIPGTAPGTTRTVPYSAVQAGLIARSDLLPASPNQAIAGKFGQPRFAVDLTQTYSDSQVNTLNDAGVTAVKFVYGGIRTYGLSSLADPDTDPLWTQFAGARLFMALDAECQAIGEEYVGETIDGHGHVFQSLRHDLEGMLLGFYEPYNALYGDTPEEAFVVDVGAQVNTEETIAAKQINAAVGVRVSPGGELVSIEIARTASNQPL